MPEYILKNDGSVVRRPVAMKVEGEVELNVDNAILSQLTCRVLRKCAHMGVMDGHTIGMCQTDTACWFLRIRLKTLNLNCTMRAVGEFAIPSFEPEGEFVHVP